MPADAVLSVVIPVYNGSLYLPDLIASLKSQQLVPDDIVFVDDGSTDGSGEMIARLSEGLAGVQVLRQENQGQAVARNVGMRAARGRYLAFLDADDVLEPACYATLVELAEKESLDIAMGNAWNFHEGRKADTLVYRDVADSGVIRGEAWFQHRWLSRYLPHYCWMQVYRRTFIDRHGFEFPVADPHEDVVWVTETLLAAERFHFVPQPLYRYRKKKTLSVPSPPRAEGGFRRHKVIESSLYNTRALAEIAARPALQPLTRKLMRKDFVNGGCNAIRQIRRLSDPAQRAHYLRRVRQERFLGILWRSASGPAQLWRVLRYQILSWL